MTIKVFDLSLDSTEPFLYDEIDQLLTDGYEIISSAVYVHGDIPGQRLMLRKAENAAANKAIEPVNTQVRAIVSIECRETYSKSTQQNFKFWTCILDNGEKVNIFDHPDESRNTYKICEAAGWLYWRDMPVGMEYPFVVPVPVVVSYDGEWYSLVNIMAHKLHNDLQVHYSKPDYQDMSPDDIPFDSETSDAINNLKSGLDLDDDGESDETDESGLADE